jgi:hypothetical protein
MPRDLRASRLDRSPYVSAWGMPKGMQLVEKDLTRVFLIN